MEWGLFYNIWFLFIYDIYRVGRWWGYFMMVISDYCWVFRIGGVNCYDIVI